MNLIKKSEVLLISSILIVVNAKHNQNGLLVTLHTFVLIYITFVVDQVHIFMVSSRASKNSIMDELCCHHFVHFGCVPIYIFDPPQALCWSLEGFHFCEGHL